VRGGLLACWRPYLSHELGDLVNLGQGLTSLLEVVVAGVDVGPHRERGVVVACPLADDGDRDAGLLTGRERFTNHAEWVTLATGR